MPIPSDVIYDITLAAHGPYNSGGGGDDNTYMLGRCKCRVTAARSSRLKQYRTKLIG